MPIKELFLDKRSEALGNTFLESQPEEEVVDTSILAAVRKRSRSWAHSKSRSDFFARAPALEQNEHPEFTSNFPADGQSIMTERVGQHTVDDASYAPMGASVITNHESTFPILFTSVPIIQSDRTHLDIRQPAIQPDIKYLEGQLQQGATPQCILHGPLPSQQEDLRSNGFSLKGAFYDTNTGTRNQPLKMPDVQSQAWETKQAGASHDIKQKFLEFVDQLKAATPKHPRPADVMSTNCHSQTGPLKAGGLQRTASLKAGGIESFAAQLQEQLCDSSSPMPSGANARVLPVGLLPSGVQKGSLMSCDLKISAGEVEASAEVNVAHRVSNFEHGKQSPIPLKFHSSPALMDPKNNSLEPPCSQHYNLAMTWSDAQNSVLNEEKSDSHVSTLSKYTVLGNIEEWRLNSHPEIPEGCTMMIRNLPECIPIKSMLDQMELLGLGEHVQCFYMPWIFSDARPMSNGYAFVNLDCAGAAEVLQQAWHDARIFLPGSSRKPCKNFNKALNIGKAKVQGLRENLLKWSRSKTARIKNDFFKPMLFNGAMKFGI